MLFKKFSLFIFRQSRREEEREGDKHQRVVASHTPPLGTWAATQACVLTGSWTGDHLVRRLVLNPLSHTSQGWFAFYFNNNDSLIISPILFIKYTTLVKVYQRIYQNTNFGKFLCRKYNNIAKYRALAMNTKAKIIWWWSLVKSLSVCFILNEEKLQCSGVQKSLSLGHVGLKT